MSGQRPETHPDGQDACAELMAGRVQALVDQLVGLAEMLKLGMAPEAYGDLDKHLAKCGAWGQLALDEYAEYHGQVCERVYADSVVEFMVAVR